MSASLLLLAPLALCAGIVALFVFRASPRTTFVCWTLVLCFVPVWIGVSVGFFWAAITLVTLAAVATSIEDVRLTPVDGFVAAFALLVLALFALRLATLSAAVIAMLEWVLPYVWGRLVLARLPARFVVSTIAVVGTAAAALALVELVTGTNVFVLLPGGGPVETWADLQVRSDLVRVEGAFGHSIALGASLAMASACIIGSRWPAPWMLGALTVVVGAVVATVSRIGLITVALTIALSLVLLPVARSARASIAALAGIAATLAVPFIGDVFLAAGDEASASADYRGRLLSLASQVQVLGSAGDWSGRAVDGVYFGAFADSVDNTLLLIALRFGWIPVLLVVGVLAATVVGALRRPANAASIAVVGQIPGLFAVALITQFGMLLWFLIGLAAAWRALDDDRAAARALSPGALRRPLHARA
ncbi:hypothetical protein [Agrococcus sp. HG114]|uniref:hypothetical protein n=1 Tax=Agrococcus sp. HG114 TaxID=2969757 RepID=UPI00215A7FCD|nr:hypothetical protein [Agrococcus sp. HG114]MCR8670843.1 hypothetical protein [Agrococcus sp. HG114]